MHTEYSGTFTDRDRKQHISFPFDLPPDSTQLHIQLQFEPARVDNIRNMLCLTLFDPAGFRGAGHRGGDHHEIIINEASATPGYLPGPLPAGRWEVVIDTHMIMPGAPCAYTLTVDASHTQVTAAATDAIPPEAHTPGRGWYRGDLHAHTIHSDASWDAAALLAAARARNLDFVTITDHNTISHLRGLEALTTDDLLVMGGMELTTFWGHALSLGTRQWIDWRIGPGKRTMPRIAEEVSAAGGLFIIAHPLSQGDPWCTGCDWRYVEMMPGNSPAVEIWNGLWNGDSNNEGALALWYQWLNWGLRIIATAGTDAHGPAPAEARPGFNVVYATRRDESSILRAVARGRLYLSSGPELILAGTCGDDSVMMGDTLPPGVATICARWRNAPASARLRLLANGSQLSEDLATSAGERVWQIEAGAARWCVAELRAEDGELLAVTNPIYFSEE